MVSWNRYEEWLKSRPCTLPSSHIALAVATPFPIGSANLQLLLQAFLGSSSLSVAPITNITPALGQLSSHVIHSFQLLHIFVASPSASVRIAVAPAAAISAPTAFVTRGNVHDFKPPKPLPPFRRLHRCPYPPSPPLLRRQYLLFPGGIQVDISTRLILIGLTPPIPSIVPDTNTVAVAAITAPFFRWPSCPCCAYTSMAIDCPCNRLSLGATFYSLARNKVVAWPAAYGSSLLKYL